MCATLVVLTLLVVSVVANDITLDTGFSKEQQQALIDVHNHYRARVAKGEERNQPKAADMLAMEWDDRLVDTAQKWSSTCQGWHNSNEERRFKPYPYTGQNYAGNMGMTESVRGWYDEVTEGNFGFYGYQCSGVCGHYTQVVWGKSRLLGCAQNRCKSYGADQSNVYCEYAPGGNTAFKSEKDPVYTEGEPCSKCPAGFGFCMGGALCASKRACSNTDSKCECTVKSCENGGTLDAAECTCKCPAGFEGLSCEKPCKDEIDFCAGYKDSQCTWNAQMWMWIGRVCRKTCGTCGAPKDPGLTNKNSIKTNVKDMSGEIKLPRILYYSEVRVSQVLQHPVGKYCKNYLDDLACGKWYRGGLCKKLPHTMEIYCKRTCDMCNTKTALLSLEYDDSCRNVLGDTVCDKYRATGECLRLKHKMDVYCRRSCGLCAQGLHTPEQDVCDNARGDVYCAFWSRRGRCTVNKEMHLDCRKACGLCHAQATSELQSCKNRQSDKTCATWVRANMCDTSTNFMLTRCKRACNFCAHKSSSQPSYEWIKGSDGDCVDERGTEYCTYWAARGECNRTPTDMRKHCQKTCDACSATPVNQDCKNAENDANCEYWASIGECDKSSGMMRLNCRKACDLCTQDYTTVLPTQPAITGTDEETDGDCQDERPGRACHFWKESGECQRRPGIMVKYCRRTCQLCRLDNPEKPTKPDTIEPTEPATEECRDEQDEASCRSWASAGHCLSSRAQMARYCQRTCDMCEGMTQSPSYVTTVTPTVIGQDEDQSELTDPSCFDTRGADECSTWKYQGHCQGSTRLMFSYCRKTCNLCGDDNSNNGNTGEEPQLVTVQPTESDADCRDEQAEASCRSWAAAGHCLSSREQMARYCQRTCDMCEGMTQSPSHVTAVQQTLIGQDQDQSQQIDNETIMKPRECVDQRGHESCQTWASQGHCQASGDVMREYCSRTCGFCKDGDDSGIKTTEPTEVDEEDCSDAHPSVSCDFWKSEGHCEKTPEQMVKLCRRTCDLCAGSHGQIVVTPSSVDETGARTTLDRNTEPPEFTALPDDQSADLGNAVVLTCTPKDEDNLIVTWRRDDGKSLPTGRFEILADKSLKITDLRREDEGTYMCSVTNGYGTSEASVELTITECTNVRGDQECSQWATDGRCTSSPEIMQYYCRLACGFCSVGGYSPTEAPLVHRPTPEPEVRTTPFTDTDGDVSSGTCVDQRGHDSCQTWASQGHCQASGDVMREYCSRTCGFCKDGDDNNSDIKPTEPTRVDTKIDESVPECVDQRGHESCQTWASQGHCQASSEIMRTYCRRSCGFCEDGDGVTNVPTEHSRVDEDCIDAHPTASCDFWKSEGHCENTPDQMFQLCRRTCALCASALGEVNVTPPIDNETIDRTTQRGIPQPPEFTALPDNQSADLGNAVVLTCTPKDEDNLIVTWRRDDGKSLPTGRYEIFANRSLKIAQVRREDKGVYICVVTNNYGTAEASVELIVTGSCVNERPDIICEAWKQSGNCQSYVEQMKLFCRRTCYCGDSDDHVLTSQSGKDDAVSIDESTTVAPNVATQPDSGHGKAITADTDGDVSSGTCLDQRGHESCQTWASQGHCQASSEIMRTYCRRSCGFCEDGAGVTNVPTEHSRVDIVGKTTSEPEVTTISGIKSEEHFQTGSSTTYPPEDVGTGEDYDIVYEECVNVQDDRTCEQWASTGHCQTSQPHMRRFCKRACSFCEPRRNGEDIGSTASTVLIAKCANAGDDQTCERWKLVGYCQTVQSHMKAQCSRTCGFCDTDAETNGSEDGDDVDRAIRPAERIDSEHATIASTLNRTQASPTQSIHHKLINTECKNVRDDKSCEQWAKDGACNEVREQMEIYCQSTCGFCPGDGTSSRLTNQPINGEVHEVDGCVDKRPTAVCHGWQATGECERSPRQMRIHCRYTCGFCESEWRPEPSQYAYRSVSCRNLRDERTCKEWVRMGECERAPSQMMMYCRQECNMCDPVTGEMKESPGYERLSTKPCTNEQGDEFCEYWANKSECFKNSDAMQKDCSKACGFCRTDGADQGLPCLDRHPSELCTYWSRTGECNTSPTFMQQNCPRTCNMCQQSLVDANETDVYSTPIPTDVHIPSTEPTKREKVPKLSKKAAECRNQAADDDCSSRNLLGECHSNRRWMKRHCAKTCDTCKRKIAKKCRNRQSKSLCSSLSSKGNCTTRKEWMQRFCAESCGFCDDR